MKQWLRHVLKVIRQKMTFPHYQIILIETNRFFNPALFITINIILVDTHVWLDMPVYLQPVKLMSTDLDHQNGNDGLVPDKKHIFFNKTFNDLGR